MAVGMAMAEAHLAQLIIVIVSYYGSLYVRNLVTAI